MAQVGSEALTLKVSEALARDVGRGIARLDPKDMTKLGVEVGDIIQVKGKRATATKVMPAFMEDRGKALIQIDGITRENAQIGIDEKAQIQKAEYRAATAIVLAPLTTRGTLKERDTGYIVKLLEGLAVTAGDKVRATLFGTRYQEFSVVDTSPKGIAIIHSTTTMKIRGEDAKE